MLSDVKSERAVSFARDGIIMLDEPLLPADDFAQLSEDFERIRADWLQRFGGRSEEMDKPHFLYPELFRYATHPAVLDLVEELIGPDIVLFTTHFICKQSGNGQRVPWHTDAGYWVDMIDPMDQVLTIWLAIDPSSEENGCVRFVPGSHKQVDDGSAYVPVSDSDTSVFPTELRPDIAQYAEENAISAVLKPNHASVHHANTIHGSRPNNSEQRRCGLTLRYFNANCKWLYQDNVEENFDVYLVRGQDRAGNTYGTVGEVNKAWEQRLASES